MKLIKNIFARCWALWGLISFVATFILAYLPFLICFFIKDERKSQVYFKTISAYWMKAWLLLIGCRIKIHGIENFQPEKNYVVIFNHNALLDIPLSSPFLPGVNKTIAKSSFAKIPIFGLYYAKGSVLVDRKNNASRAKSFEDMKATLKKGFHMCIYPEGTRNRTNEIIKPFFDGAFKLAIDTNKEIIPCIIKGTKIAMPIEKKFYLMPATLELYFLNPVSPENTTVKELNTKLYNIMKQNCIEKEI